MHKIVKSAGLAIVALLMNMGNVHAALVNFEITGNIDAADAGNIYGLIVGDTITVGGTFDDSVLTGGTGSVLFDFASGNTLSISAGTQTYNETNEISFFSGGFPNMTFENNVFSGFNYTGETTDGDSFFQSGVSTFIGEDLSVLTIAGTWDANSLVVTPVPVPAAILLFGSGLLGLVGFLRRKTA